MKNKKKIKVKYIIITIFLIIILFLTITNIVYSGKIKESFSKYAYSEPIDKETGIINNEYFNINSKGKDAQNTTKGLSDAIEYATKNNIKYIKLEKGHYLINGTGDRITKKGIQVKSNISIDLNNSTFEHEENDKIRYSIFTLYDVENVSMKNGIIVGDRKNHNYNNIESTHEWGYGIEIQGGRNVELINMQIQSTTGDGILITRYKDNDKTINSENIKISNNIIYDCRRQGISLICGKNIEIHDNEIYKINGTAPGATIDLEPDNDTQKVENVKIYNNKLYSQDNKTCIQIIEFVKNTEIYDNMINGSVAISAEQEKGKIENNDISNGTIRFYISTANITDKRFINKIEVLNNNFTNCSISILNVNNIFLNKNNFNNSNIIMQKSNGAIANNQFNEIKDYAFKYQLDSTDENRYNIYLYNNEIDQDKEKIPESNMLKIYRSKNELDKYINSTFN